ncbi:PREDICTED: uncharacterized protein LOC109476998 [Branchiostoma belcheri]|uniref:Uncharacterized protein LOC109476998 n=1 Tax=Branchiostoma belcheri TaxID=7741 RepID=A0A6P4YW48_BRABE|nr:PREDICTED: uncharacterized protein LOC109476998 [Branchiostoma belcheri]
MEVDVPCPGWNEAACPGGLPAHNESEPHKNVVQIRDNVRAIDPAVTTLYMCPVTLGEEYGDNAALFLAPYPTPFQDGDVIVSGQAGGVMHVVESTAPVGPFAFVLGSAANIEDVVAYSSFKEEVDPVAIDDDTTEEDVPDPVLLSTAISGDLPVNSSNVTVINNVVPVYKCVGNGYVSNSGDEWVSMFLVFKATDFNDLGSEDGDILVGSESNGWLETVTGVNAGDEFSFVRTDLVRCGEDLPDGNSLTIPTKSEDNIPDLHCVGGDNSKGILVYENATLENLGFATGDTIVGRKSGAFLSKVMSRTQKGDLVFVEVSPVSTLQDSEDSTNSSISTRRRRATIDAHLTFSKTVSITIPVSLGPAEITFGAKAGFKLGFEFTMELGWSSPFVQQAGARFFGSAELSVSAKASISASVSRSWSKMLKEGNIKSFCIPIWGPICLPTKLRYEIPAKIEVSASVEFEISCKATASASASMGVSWSSGRGLTPRFDTDFNIDLSKDAKTKAEGSAKLTGTITPTLLLDVPAPGLPINIPIPRWLLPRFIRRLLDKYYKS